MVRKPSGRGDFRLAIICALPIEYDAVHASLDEVWDDWNPHGVPGDSNHYLTGRIEEIPVVLVLLPGMGKAAAASVSASLQSSYVNLEYALLVGICGAIPKTETSEIMLGDVIVGKSIVNYDFGRRYPDNFQPKSGLQDMHGRLPKLVRIVQTLLETRAHRKALEDSTARTLSQLQDKFKGGNDGGLYEYPGSVNDRLFEPSYRHKHQDASACRTCANCHSSADPVCAQALELSCMDLGCSTERLVGRDRQDEIQYLEKSQSPDIHLGGIASADTVMKSGEHRDQIASRYGIIAFEMEGAGIWDELPCIIVKGVCDYADSHKNKKWQLFASATAASAAKAIIANYFPRKEPESLNPASQICHSIPLAENEAFVGRENVLEELERLIFLKDRKRAALVGLGGAGKTQIALKMAYRTAANKPDYSVFWMPAFSMMSFEQACTDLAKKLQIPVSLEDDSRMCIKSYLESEKSGNWLFILDNADDEDIVCGRSNPHDTISAYLPRNTNGRILITTRSRAVAVKMVKNAIVQLDMMSFDEAQSLLEEALTSSNRGEDNRKLFEMLGHLPLAISQAASYMNMNAISVSEYLHLLENSEEDMKELMSSDFEDDNYYDANQHTVMTTWNISFNQIRDQCPAAARLLSFIRWIEPKAIPRSLLPEVGSKQEKTNAIGVLKGYGFLSSRRQQDIYDMHSLVHFVMTLQDNSGMREALSHITEVFPTWEWNNRNIWQDYLPHAMRIYWQCGEPEREVVQEFGVRISWCLGGDGRYKEQIAVLEMIVASYNNVPEQDRHRLFAQYSLARAYQENGQIKDAAELIEHVLGIQKEVLTEDNPDLLRSQLNLAAIYYSNGHNQKAIDLLEHVVATRKRTLPESHPERLVSQHELATAYLFNGQTQKAVDLIEYVVAIRKSTLPEMHPNLLASQHQLATAYRSNGQTQKAVDLIEHVVAVRKLTHPEMHPNLLVAQHQLASIYISNGQLQEAVHILEHVVLQQKLLQEDHPSRLASQHELAVAYYSNGQTQKAIELLTYIVGLKEGYPEAQPDRLASQNQLATLYRSNGQIQDALDLIKHVVAIRKEVLPEDHPDRLGSQHELAMIYRSNGQTQEAIDLFEYIVAFQKKTLSKTHPRQLTTQHELAIAYRSNGQIQKAVSIFEYIVNIKEQELRESHPSRLASQHELAITYRFDGQIQKAINVIKHVVAIKKEVLSKSHPNLLASQHELGVTYLSNGQIQEAYNLLEHLVALKEALPNDHPEKLASQHQLARVYRSNGQTQKAVDLFEYIVKLREALPKDHPNRLASQSGLAVAYCSNSQCQKAVNLLEYIVEIEKEALREDDPTRLATQRYLATAYRSNGQIREALDLIQHVVALEDGLLETNLDKIASKHVLATSYQCNGRIQEAVDLFEHVVALREALPKTHPDRLLSQHELARAYHSNGQIQQAVDLLEHVLNLRKEALPESHPDRLESQDLLNSFRQSGAEEKPQGHKGMDQIPLR